MTVHFTADEIEFVADEYGWEMHITDDEGIVHVVNIHRVASDVLADAKRTIGAWEAEGEAAKRAEPRVIDGDDEPEPDDSYLRASYDMLLLGGMGL